jgi:hypothetical protein
LLASYKRKMKKEEGKKCTAYAELALFKASI